MLAASALAAVERPAWLDPSRPLDARADALLSRMTLEEKVGQMNMPCVYERRLGESRPAKTKACRRFAAGTQEPGIGPGGGFFTLPNTILHEGPRQQAALPERAAADRAREDAAGHPAAADRRGHPRPDVRGRDGLPGGARRSAARGTSTCSRKSTPSVAREARAIGVHQVVHAGGRAEPRPAAGPQPGGLLRRPVARVADRRDDRARGAGQRRLRFRTRSSRASATTRARASR